MANVPLSSLIATIAEAEAGVSRTALMTAYLVRRVIYTIFPEKFDIYVDSENGDDGNDGLTPETALATASAIPWADNIRVGFARGSLFRESIIGSNTVSDVWLDAYGTGRMPIFACDDVIEGTWTQPDPETYPNVWMQTLAHAVTDPNQYLSMWADDVRMYWVEDLETLNDPPTVDQAGGYYHVATTTDNTGQPSVNADFYIYSTTNPNGNGVVYEYSARNHGIQTGTRWLVRNIHTRRNGHNNGSLIIEAESEGDSCLGTDGVKHNIWCGPNSIVRNCIVWKSDWFTRDAWSGFVGYVWDGRGLKVTFEDNIVVVEDHIFEWSLANNALPVGFLAHNNSDEEGWDEVIFRRNAVYGAITGIEVNNAKLFTDDRNYVGGCRFGIVSAAARWDCVDPWIEELEDRTVVRALSRNGLGVVSIEGARIYLENGGQSGGAIYMPGSEFWSVTKSVIYRDGTDQTGFTILIGNEVGQAAGRVTQCVLHGINGGGNGMLVYNANSVVEDNAYWAFAMQFQGSSNFFLDWDTYAVGETVRDQNSTMADPLVIDPANGDFSLDPSSPAVALGAGLERPNITYTTIPSIEELEAM